ncbi:hypothetical protein PG985_007633 [Apiospora marii]|uniref:uncharacterized protein n=1 Tax=Apiospora marii TaxID=335849 RepID=UPI00312FAE43
MSIADSQTRGGADRPCRAAVEVVSKVLPRGGMAVSVLIPVFHTEGSARFWANFWPSLVPVLLTVATWYPFPGPWVEFVLLRIPELLVVASTSAVLFDQIRDSAVLPYKQCRLFPDEFGKPSSRQGSQLSPQDSIVFANMGDGFRSLTSAYPGSDLSLPSDTSEGDQEPSIAEGNANLDLEAAPGDTQLRL